MDVNGSVYFFLDTNLFIQCKPLHELPWLDLTNGKPAILLIPSAVQREIDRLKTDSSKRRSKRAAAASSMFKKIIVADERINLEGAPPGVYIELPEQTALRSDLYPLLDKDIADDMIVLEVLSFKSRYPERDIRLVTHDTGPMLTARRNGLAFLDVPSDWLLPPEPDEKDKKIQELQKRLSEVGAGPLVEITVDDGLKSGLSHVAQVHSYLSDADIASIVHDVTRRNPMKTDFSEPKRTAGSLVFEPVIVALNIGTYVPPPDEVVSKYQKKDYPAWLKSVEAVVTGAPDYFNNGELRRKVSFSVSNVGSKPAEDVIVSVRVTEGFLLISADAVIEDDEINIPAPPTAPVGRYRTALDVYADRMGMTEHARRLFSEIGGPLSVRGSRAASLVESQVRDRHTFYWRGARPESGVSVCALESKELRHKVRGGSFDLYLLMSRKARKEKGVIEITVSAANIPDPVVCRIPVSVQYESADSYEKVRAIVGA